MFGAAMETTITSTMTVTISSINVKPAARCVAGKVGERFGMAYFQQEVGATPAAVLSPVLFSVSTPQSVSEASWVLIGVTVKT